MAVESKTKCHVLWSMSNLEYLFVIIKCFFFFFSGSQFPLQVNQTNSDISTNTFPRLYINNTPNYSNSTIKNSVCVSVLWHFFSLFFFQFGKLTVDNTLRCWYGLRFFRKTVHLCFRKIK